MPPTPPLGRPTPQQLDQIKAGLDKYKASPDISKMSYDSNLWYNAIRSPGTSQKGDILARVFTVLRWGGFYFRTDMTKNDWRRWRDTGWPIATALSHGGRVMIQLPRYDPRHQPGNVDIEDAFLTWLTCGCAGTTTCFKRQGTHSTGNRPDDVTPISDGRMKVLEELHGFGHGAGQFFHTASGGSYGVNLALGGAGNRTFATDQLIGDNGSHGHLYIFYRRPKPDKYGGMLIGCEGEAPDCYGASGNLHTMNVEKIDKWRGTKPSQHEGQFGPKWKDKGGTPTLALTPLNRHSIQQMPMPDPIQGPDKYDSSIVDLTSTGWQFLKRKAETFSPAMVFQPAQPAPPIAVVAKSDGLERGQNVIAQVLKLDKAEMANVVQEYKNLPAEALQLRLTLLTKDIGKNWFGPKNIRSVHTYVENEVKALINAIYVA